jgi:hypothetical protein
MGGGGKGEDIPTTIPLDKIPTYGAAGSSPYYFAEGADATKYKTDVAQSPFTNEQRYSAAQTAAEQQYLKDNPDVAASGMNPFVHWVEYGSGEGRTFGTAPVTPKTFSASASASNAKALADKAAADKKAYDRSVDLKKIDDMWAARGTAELDAINAADAAIALEKQNANVLGTDYNISDSKRQRRIGSEFSKLWASEHEDTLFNLTKKYGNPEQDSTVRELIEANKKSYEWEYPVTRGASKTGSQTPAQTTTTATAPTTARKRGRRPGDSVIEDEDVLGGANPLGV